jgi:hypothetical protein
MFPILSFYVVIFQIRCLVCYLYTVNEYAIHTMNKYAYTQTSLSTLNTILPSNTSPWEITPHRLFKIRPVPKIPRKYWKQAKQGKKKLSQTAKEKYEYKQSQHFRCTNSPSAGKTACQKLRKMTRLYVWVVESGYMCSVRHKWKMC